MVRIDNYEFVLTHALQPPPPFPLFPIDGRALCKHFGMPGLQPPNTLAGPAAPRPTSPSRRKRKLRPWMPQKEARRRMKRYAGDASALLQEALPLATKLSENAGIPGLSIGLEALLTILEKIETMRTNVEGVETLKTRVEELTGILRKCPSQPRDEQFDDIRRRLEVLCKKLSEAAANAEGIRSRNIIKRFFTSNSDAKKLQGLVEDINTAIQDFVTQTVLSIDENVHVVVQKVTAIETQLEMSLLSTYAKRAQYNSGDSQNVRGECLEGTREEVLADAYRWIHRSSEEVASCTTEEKSGHILWINGGAGTGKTTIACSIAKKYDALRTLSASFFCSRSDAECRDPNFIFVTIARQLCQYYEPFKDKVVAILKQKPDVVNANPLEQFKALILQPLRELNGVFPTCVIVIDALDECQNKGLKSVILNVLASHIRELAPFLFVVTSRPEPHITAFFERANESSLQDSTKPLNLNNMYLELTRHDIRRVLAKGFRDIRDVFAIQGEWPSNRDLNKLTELSDGLFIFATTVLRFIGDYGNPKKQLQALLAASASVMYELYGKILELAYKKVHDLHRINPSVCHVLGAITLAEEPLSTAALADLLGMSEEDVRNTLSRLRSVLHVPEEGSEDTIRFIHPTFPEFLLDASADKPEAFRINPAEHHLTLFCQSLKAMDGLTRNIAGIERPVAFKSELDGLPDTVKRCIPAYVAYACRFWSIHLSHCTPGPEGFGLFERFLTRQMLFWVEACSLLRILDGALAALETAGRACKTLGGSFADLGPLLADCHRFLWTYYYCIDAAPLQVYHSALAFAPTESLVMKTYTRELDSSLIVRSGALSDWPPRRDAFSGHDGKPVFAIVFSSGGDYFVTGGGDGKLKMWKTSTRAGIRSFDRHTDEVICVALSPDGAYVASGSDDRDVRVWQVSSGECIHVLKGHTDWVSSVAYSADGCRLLSATQRGEVKLWDTADGRCILTLNNTGNHTWQAGLSPDGGVIARGSGASLSLYDVSSATDETIDFPDTVIACTFSPDGRFVAARSARVIRVWQCTDKSLVHSIDVSEELWSRLAFSRDGARIACGSENGTVVLWQVASEDPPLVLPGHTAVVLDVSWSPDGLQVASASEDGTIRVCDVISSLVRAAEATASQPVASGPPQFVLAGHKGDTVLLQLPPVCVDFAASASMPDGAPTLTPFTNMLDACNAALHVSNHPSRIAHTRAWALITGHQHVDFSATLNSCQLVCVSPNGALLAYRSPTSDDVVDVCDLRDGTVVASLTGHTVYVLSIAFSHDSALITTGSKDTSVKVWGVTTGDLVYSHEDHTHWVRALTFSSDSRLVASGSYDKSVRVFEATTGRVEQVFDGHRDWVVAVVFIAEDKRVLTLDDSDWIYIWDIATGARLFDISLHDDFWIHSLDFSPDGAAILTGGGRHEMRTSSLPMRSSPTWPVYVVAKDGWVYAKSPGHTVRLCWLPPEWRSLPAWDGATFHCLDAERKTVVTIDVSRDPEYARVWGTGV